MFRYERPQKGRYRQISQFGIELIGVEKPQADIEVLSVGYQLLQALDLQGNISLLINTLGDQESRDIYREKLVNYFNSRESELSAESKIRLSKNPLRILDSKEESDRRVNADAPKLSDSLTPTARAFFDQVLEQLTALNIPFKIDDKLVRGLDYYMHTVFEFVTDSLGSQNAVLAGGRYDRLISDMGGPVTPGVGWGMGIDRLSLLLKSAPPKPESVSVVPLGPDAESMSIKLAQELRSQNIPTDLGFSGNLQKRMKRADKIGSRFAIIFGSDELSKGAYQVKDLKAGTQTVVATGDLVSFLRKNLA
jgi:histidyl-tRNA synthetase